MYRMIRDVRKHEAQMGLGIVIIELGRTWAQKIVEM
jgi:hypothetical protein